MLLTFCSVLGYSARSFALPWHFRHIAGQIRATSGLTHRESGINPAMLLGWPHRGGSTVSQAGKSAIQKAYSYGMASIAPKKTSFVLFKFSISKDFVGKDEEMLLHGRWHGWPGHPHGMPVRQVITLPKQIMVFISINRWIYIEMRL